MLNIYGEYTPALDKLLKQMTEQFTTLNQNYEKKYHERLYEHLRGRVKSEKSMECKRNALFRFFYINETYTKKHDTLPKKTYCKTK